MILKLTVLANHSLNFVVRTISICYMVVSQVTKLATICAPMIWGRSIVGYFIVSTDHFHRVVDFFVDIADLSNHFPLVCSLRIETSLANQKNYA